jgi:hypothetical protein
MANSVDLGFEVGFDGLADLMKALAVMEAKDVVAGFPQEDEKPREDEDGNPSPITNAALGYIHNTGMPEQNIPARPFMVEGIESKEEPIGEAMKTAGSFALEGNAQGVEQALNAVGLIAKNGIQMKILDGPFDPLADSTLEARAARGRQGAQAELDRRENGEDPGVDLARPLNDTGQMRNAVNYALREK